MVNSRRRSKVRLDAETERLIINQLRLGTVVWAGRKDALRKARVLIFEGRVTKAGRRIEKLYWKCAECQQMFRDEGSMEVDHIEEIGSFTGDWNDYIARMYCGPENLRAVCRPCHGAKTVANASARIRRKKSKNTDQEGAEE